VPTELGTINVLAELCVRRPHPPRLDVCTATGLWAECGGGVRVCRALSTNNLTGPVPSELGNLDAMSYLCVRHLTHRAWTRAPSPGLWAERGGGG
jgi:hypothetical protein